MEKVLHRVQRFAAYLFVAVALAATNAEAQSNSQPSSSAGELNVGLSGLSSETLDPILGGHNVKFYLGQIYDYLVGVDASGDISKALGLARDWQVSPDKMQWTFYLREGVRFHNGDPVTAEDVKFALTRAMGPRSTTGYADVLRDSVASITTPGPYQVVITTKLPSPFLLEALSGAVSTEGMIVPKAYIEANGDNYFGLHPIGSGPYKAVEHIAGSYIKLEAAGQHWRTGVPRYKNIYIRLIPEETTRIAMLRQGKLDITDISADRVEEVRKYGFPVRLKKADALINCWWIESWGNGPLGDRRVREALNVAIDRKEISETIFSGLAKPASIPLGFSWSYKEVGFAPGRDLDYDFDAARAKKLLADAGHANGFEATILSFPAQGFPQSDTLVQAIAGYWGNIGIKANIIAMDYPAARKKWFDRSAPGALACFNQGNRSAFGQYAALTKFTAFAKPCGIMHDSEVTRLVTAMGSETDRQKWNQMMVAVFKRMRSESVDVPIADIDTPYAVSKTLPAWDPGTVMNELNFDQLVRAK